MISTAELYLRATTSAHLDLRPHRQGCADTLIAAGASTAQRHHRGLALRAWRLRASTDMQGARALANDMASMAIRMSVAHRGARPSLSRLQAADLALDTLKWWCLQACPSCKGRGHPVIPSTPHLDTTRACHYCAGTGIRPLRKCVKHPAIAQRLVDMLEAMAGLVFADMARKLAIEMDF